MNKREVPGNQGPFYNPNSSPIRYYECDLVVKTGPHGLLTAKDQENCNERMLGNQVEVAVKDGEIVGLNFSDQNWRLSH